MSYALLAIIGNVVCWRLKYWKNWKEYYPTILFVYVGNLIYDVLTHSRPLWSFGNLIFKYPILDLMVMALLYPATVILYLSHYPSGFYKQVLYVLMWSAIFDVSELVAWCTNGFDYYNGWTIIYSIIFNLIMFPVIRLHHKKPLFVWPICGAMAMLIIWWFRIPLAR